jgi:RHS repeat-associated protein
MGCPELTEIDYFTLVRADKPEDCPTRRKTLVFAHTCPREACPPSQKKNRYKPVFYTVISIHRYYSPELGRWLSIDPIGEAGGMNLYAMVDNNPINDWDYLGLFMIFGAGEPMHLPWWMDPSIVKPITIPIPDLPPAIDPIIVPYPDDTIPDCKKTCDEKHLEGNPNNKKKSTKK